MQMFAEWITQIILFILLGTILELLLPSNQMKKYVNLILGLLLLLLLSKPILFVLSVDVKTMVSQFDETILQDDQLYNQTENAIINQKNEIQVTQDAYIWNEVASQLKQEANDMLQKEYGQVITDLSLEYNDDSEITLITCIISSTHDKHESRKVDPVQIKTMEDSEHPENTTKLKGVNNSLADLWGVDKNIINLELEGGTN